MADGQTLGGAAERPSVVSLSSVAAMLAAFDTFGAPRPRNTVVLNRLSML